jgi:hypothetical protein
VLARARHWSLSWAIWIQSIFSLPHTIFFGFDSREGQEILLHKIQTSCGVHSASPSVDTRRFSPEIKRERVKLTTYLHQVSKLRMRGTLPPFLFRRHNVQVNYEQGQFCITLLQRQSLPGSIFPSDLSTEILHAFLKSLINAKNTDNFEGVWRRVVISQEINILYSYAVRTSNLT